MRGRIALGVSTLALLVGFVTAPYTHAHPTGHQHSVDGQHRREPMRHIHLTPHGTSHAPVSGSTDEARDEHEGPSADVLTADDFVFPTVGHLPWQVPAVLAVVVTFADRTSIWFAPVRPGPPAHGPPATSLSAPRAPPEFSTAAA